MLTLALGAALVVTASPGPPPGTDSATGGPPPMGWSSWSFLRHHPTAASIEAEARAMKSSDLASYGYRYVNVDDFWMACDGTGPEVDSFGRWIPDRAAFPAGIAAVASRVHAEGLKFGLYVTPGIPENAVRRNTAIEENIVYRQPDRQHLRHRGELQLRAHVRHQLRRARRAGLHR